jgi:hypothetical protein
MQLELFVRRTNERIERVNEEIERASRD